MKNGAAPTALPVRQIEDQLLAAVERGNRLVLTAPTGSGKTTQIPQMLLHAVRGEILVLQPRRLAARLVAQRVAAELEVPLGGLVGYQTRHDSKVGPDTRVRFITEGLFLRRLQSDPQLKEVGAVVLDEFHERSLAADLSLGLVRRLQESTRPDLRLLLMSATLDADSLARWLDCPALTTQGRTYPVDIRYRSSPTHMPPWQAAAQALKALLDEGDAGDVLVFMPGAYEIRRTIQAMQNQFGRSASLVFYPLYSSLPARQQDAALAPNATRKVIVATNVAETSITIEGIGHVIDSGLARVHRHDPRRGIDALLIENISSAAAEQRAGRAGRTAAGTCTRLWSSEEQHARPERDAPEIQRLDLADALLQLHSLHAGDLDDFPWLDPPDADAVNRAHTLLKDLGALDAGDALTSIGQQMAQLPCHPRLGRFLVEAAARHCLERACIWAALIGERDLLEQPLRKEYSESVAAWPSDLNVRERALQRAIDGRFNPASCSAQGINAHAARQVGLTAKLYRDAARRSGLKENPKAKGRGADEALGKCLLCAFYDRVAVRRGGGDSLLCAMAGQRRVELDRNSCVRQAQAFVALEVRELEARGDSQVRTALSLASAIDTAWLQEVHPERVTLDEETRWNAETRAVETLEQHLYGDLVYYQAPAAEVDAVRAEEILVEQIVGGHIRLEKWDRDVEQWLWRARLLQRLFPQRQLVAYDEDEMRIIYHEIVAGATRYSHMRNRPCLGHVQNALPWKEQQFVEQMAPTHWKLPRGPRMKIEYSNEGPPRGRAKIQELYDLQETPSIAGGKQKLLLEILGPNFRPVQVTDDLQSFWQRTYPEIKKDLKRRYPKHEWR